ncbi:MAG: DMT family transporter [Proteobacteria bacterium]|nr:DMT family transporter [Pseudomonadota bacterium]
MTAAGACFTVMAVLIRPAAAELHTFEILFLRNLFALMLMAPLMSRARFAALRGPRLRLYLLCGLFMLVSMATWFYAIPLIPLVQAVSLHFTTPLFVTVLAILVLGETVGVRRWSAVVLGFAGVIVILRPGMAEVSPASLLVLVSTFAWAVTIMVIRILTRTETARSIVGYMFLVLTPFSLVPALFVWQAPSLGVIGVIAALSAAGVVGHLCATRAFAATETTIVIPFEYVRMPMFALTGFLFFGEVPEGWTLLGSAVIIAAAIYIARREAQVARERR